MKKNLRYVLFAVFATFSFLSVSAQNQVYWREGFEPTENSDLTTTSPTASVGYYFTGSNGTYGPTSWYGFNIYRTTGTSCTLSGYGANHVRYKNISGVTDSGYIVTPVVSFGIKEFHMSRARTTRSHTIWATSDTSATTTNWTVVAVMPSYASTPLCVDTTVLINSATAKRLKITGRPGTDTDVDSIYVTSFNLIAPVKFGAISLSQTNGFTKVTWNVISEINTEKYLIERSDNGSNFYTVGSLTAINASKYIYIDNTPLNNVIGYYRIKAVDKDGSMGYSSVVKIGGKQTATDIAIAPNPVKGGQLNVQLSNFTKGKYTFALYDAAGKQIFNKSIAVEAANGAETLQLPSTVQNGAYQLQVTNGESRITKTVMVQ